MLVLSLSGTKVENPTPAQAHALLFEDQKAWKFTPDASIVLSEGERSCTLLIVRVPNVGYYVQFVEGSHALWVLVQDRSELGEHTIRMSDGSDISQGLICDQGTTWLAIEWFLKTGSRSRTLDWLQDKDLPSEARF
jgi:hypothetical protein